MSGTAQRKKRSGQEPSASASGTKTRRTAPSRAEAEAEAGVGRGAGAPEESALPTETIDVMDTPEDGVEEVVDLTCEASEAAVVDLTVHNDSVLLVDEDPHGGRVTAGGSYVLSSDDEDMPPPSNTLSSLNSTFTTRSTPGLISCPVCLDVYTEIVGSGRLVVSTKCGHVFCSQCLRDALTSSHTCPTCRKKLTRTQYHPLYI